MRVPAFTLQHGGSLRNAELAFKTYGTLAADRSNAIVYPTWFTGTIDDNEWLIGRGMALDPTHYFIIVPAMLGNGQSSSPSNPPSSALAGAAFPRVSLLDNVRLQHTLVAEHFGVSTLELVVGWSMGAQQAYQWGCMYPDMAKRIAPLCGSAKTSPHNFVFLEGVKAALTADAAWRRGKYSSANPPTVGLRAVARVYAGWGLSQAWYRQELWRTLGYASLEGFLQGYWERLFLRRDANNLLSHLDTWQAGDISDNPVFRRDLKAALAAITAKVLVMPAQQDLYFPPEDSEWEVRHMRNAGAAAGSKGSNSGAGDASIGAGGASSSRGSAVLRRIPGDWGHFAGSGISPEDTEFIDASLKELLADKRLA
jgi:homoserine O-acetyltransferase